MAAPSTTFGPFVLRDGTLLRSGEVVALGQRGLALLTRLLEADGPVAKDALLDAAWPGLTVEEGNLTVQIAALRKALGARDDGADWIVTIPRLGYRLLRGEPLAGEPTRLPRLAVLPFQNLGGDPEQDYFADGIVADITAALSRFTMFSVVHARLPKGSAVDVREVSREFQAKYLLQGSVRRSGDRLRIGAQLVDGTGGAHLWAHNYDGTVADVFEFQDRITESVASLVEPTVKRAEIERARHKPPASLDAYDFYLQALALSMSPEPSGNAQAIALIEQSLSLDPDFVPAIAVASGVYHARFDRQLPGSSEAARVKGLVYAHRALAAAGSDANTRALAGLSIIMLGREYDSGMAALQRAVAENPNSVNVLSLAAVGALRGGDLEEAERYFNRAIALNTTDLAGHWLFCGMAHLRITEGRYEDALAWCTRALAASPTNDVAHWLLAAANAQLGRLDEAVRWRERLQAVAPYCTLARVRQGQHVKDPQRIVPIIEGLRLAGLPE